MTLQCPYWAIFLFVSLSQSRYTPTVTLSMSLEIIVNLKDITVDGKDLKKKEI